jgi:hypothetical protein
MDYDRNQFLTDVFEALLELPGDPVRQLDHAVAETIALHVKFLKQDAQAARTAIIEMAEEKRKNPHGGPVRTRWATTGTYDRRR